MGNTTKGSPISAPPTSREAQIDYTTLGRTEIKVSRLRLGTMNFGPETDEATSHRIIERAVDLDLKFLDTANVYGWKPGEGWTEQIIGRWLAQDGGRREKTMLATKVYGGMGEGPNDRGGGRLRESLLFNRREASQCRPGLAAS